MTPYALHRLAKRELDRAIAYHEKKRKGLGLRLRAEVRAAIQLVQENPKAGAPYSVAGFRYQLVRRFNYVVYYADLPDEVFVVAIAHGSQRPAYWKKRKLR